MKAMVLLRLVAKTNGTTFPSDAILKPPTNISVQAIEDEQDQQQRDDDDDDDDSTDSNNDGADEGRSRRSGGGGGGGGGSSLDDQASLKLLMTHPELRKRQLVSERIDIYIYIYISIFVYNNAYHNI